MFNVYLLSTITCAVTFLLFIPFIDFLYRMKMRDPVREKNRIDSFGHTTEVFDAIKSGKNGTPVGGGILVVITSIVFFSLAHFFKIYSLNTDKFIMIISTFILFGLLGFYDDLIKVFKFKGLCLRVRHKLLLQLFFGGIISYLGIYYHLFFIKIPFTPYEISNPFFLFGISLLTIIFMSNAFNILDGIDGLSAGSLLITIIPLTIFILNNKNNLTEMVFIYILFGTVLAYLYFNINPARLIMGDAGAVALGSIIGLLTMMTGTFFLLPIFGIVYIVDAFSSLAQWISMYFWHGRRIFKIAPIHHHFEAIGWESTKVVFRFWVFNVFFSLLAVGLFFLFW